MTPSPAGERLDPPAGPAAAQRALIELTEAAGAGASLPEVLERVAQAAATVVAGVLVHVWIASQDGRELRLAAEIGGRRGHAGLELRRALPLGEGLLGAVVRSAEPVIVPSLTEDPRLRTPAGSVIRDSPRSPASGWRAGAAPRRAVPPDLAASRLLAAGGRLPPRVGAHAAIAIEGAALLEGAAGALRRLRPSVSVRAERVKVAADVGQLLATTRDSDRMVDLIAEKCREVLGAEAFGLFRLERDQLHYIRGFGIEERFRHIALGEGLVGRAALDRRAMETADLLAGP